MEGCNTGDNARRVRHPGRMTTVTRCVARGNGTGVTKYSGFRTGGGSPVNFQYSRVCRHLQRQGGLRAERQALALNPVQIRRQLHPKGCSHRSLLLRLSIHALRGQQQHRGLDIGAGSVVENCAIRNNTGDGVRISRTRNAVVRRSRLFFEQETSALSIT